MDASKSAQGILRVRHVSTVVPHERVDHCTQFLSLVLKSEQTGIPRWKQKILGHRSTTTNCPDCPKDSHLMQFIEMIRNWNPENASWNCSKDAQWCTYSERPAACKACVKYKSCQSSEWNNGNTTNHAKNMKHCLDGKACIQCSKRAGKNRRKTCRLPLTNSSQEPKHVTVEDARHWRVALLWEAY